MSDTDHSNARSAIEKLILGCCAYSDMRKYVNATSGSRLEKLFRMLWMAAYDKDNAEFQRLLKIAYTTSYIWQYSGLNRVVW